MQFALALLAGFAATALAAPQGITAIITPTGVAPAGCTANAGAFKISVTTLSSKAKRANDLTVTLADGVLTDSNGKRGYVADNYQFQFDWPVQNGAIYTAGFSVCQNGTIALGDSAIWYECLSGNFYNLYTESWAPQCKPIFLDAIPVASSASVSTAAGTVTSGSQSGATTAASAVTSSAAVVTAISDNQPQGPTATTAVTSSVLVVSSVVPTTSSVAMLTQISDLQPQAPTATSAVTSSYVVVSSTTITPAVTYSTTSVAIVTQISDHQVQAPTATSVSVIAYTGAAALPTMAAQLVLAAAGAAVMML